MINDRNLRNLALAACLLLAMPAGLLPTTSAQNRETDLARENERLQGQVTDLEAALEAAMRKIDRLEKRIQELESAPGQGSSPTPTKVAIPEASPDGFVERVRKTYAEAIASGEIQSPSSATDDASRNRSTRMLQKWIAATNRRLKERVEWPVLVTGMEKLSTTAARIQLTPWNPKEKTTCGDPFPVQVPPRILENIRRSRLRAQGETPIFLFAGVFEPRISYNPQRLEVGPFDNPRFIAPGVEMRWNVDFKAIGDYAPAKKPSSSPSED